MYVDAEPVREHTQLVRNRAKEDAPTEPELNALGKDGWELAGLFSDSPFLYLYEAMAVHAPGASSPWSPSAVREFAEATRCAL